MTEHDPLCRLNVTDCGYGNTNVCHCLLIARARADEARKHHQVEVQGGTWRICCSTCKTHVRPHFMCVLDSHYDGPLPEGHSYEEGS
jgi:hypothetical protein